MVDRFCHSESRAFHVLLAQFSFIIKPSGTAAPTGRVNLINLLMFGGVEVHAPPALTGSHGSQFEHPDRTNLERYTHRFTFKCLCCCLTLSLCFSSEAAEEVQPSSHVTSSVKTMTKAPAGAPRQGNGVPPPAAKNWHSGNAAGERTDVVCFVCATTTFCHRLHAF